VYLTGTTDSSNFPTASAYQSVLPNSGGAVFVTKLGASGGTLVYSTYLGTTDSASISASSIAADDYGNAYVAGMTQGTTFPIQSPYQASSGGSADGFLVKLGPTGTTLTYGTYLGGTGYDYGTGVAVDAYGNAYVTGYANSTNFPTSAAYRATNAGGADVFVAKFGLSAAPTVTTNAGLRVFQGLSGTIGSAALDATDTDSTTAQVTFTVVTAPARGTLKLSGTAVPAGGTFTLDDIFFSRLTYANNGSSTLTDSFVFSVSDGGGGTIGNTTFAITITPRVLLPVAQRNSSTWQAR
jgi:hypothetical protein